MVSENFDIEFQSRFDELMKARRASVGEIRVHSNGVKYQKQPDGSWKPVKGQEGEFRPFRSETDFGKDFKQFKGYPKEAILYLTEVKEGQVKGVWEREDVGSIDLVWGGRNQGLRHIIKKHLKKDFSSYKDMAEKIDIILRKGELSKDKNDYILTYGDYRVVLLDITVYDKDDNFNDKRFILTSYNHVISKEDKKSSSSKLQSNSVEVRGTTLKKSLDHTTPDDSVLQHGLDPFRYKTSPVSIDSFYKEESGRSYSSLPKGTTNMNDMQQFVDEIIEKSKKGAPIGTERTWGGKVYIRTEQGWRPKRRDKSEKEEDKTNKNSSKVNDINSFASKASDEQLQAAIKDKDASLEVKQAAQEELNKRNKKNDKFEIDTTNASEKKSKKITEEVLSQKLDKLKEDLTKKIDDKLNEINGFKKITQTYVKVDGNTIVLNMKGDDKYKAKKGDFYMESEPHEPLGEFKKRVKEAYENKLKEEKIEQKETTIPTKDKVEDKKKVNRSVAKIQVFTPNGQFLFGDTSKALESGKDIEFTKDKTTYRLLIADDLENDVYTLRNQDTGKEVTWKGGLIRLKAQIEEVNKTEQSKPTLRFENEKELKEFIDKRNSLKGLNITNSLKEKLLKSFRKKDSQEIRKDYTEKIKELSQDIKDKNFEKILESYALASNDYKFIINEELINNDYLPVANGILYSEYDGREYRHFDEKIEANLFYKADVNKSNKVEKRALEYYSMTGYEAIRAFNIGEINNAGTGRISSIISSYIDKHPIEDNLVLNRRMEISSNINGLNQWIGAEIGDIVEEKSFASFSLSQLSQFGNDLQITLLAKKGDKISNINNDFEYEYLVQKNSKYKVIAKGTNSIVVELV